MRLCADVCVFVCMLMCECQACELLQVERDRVERLAQIVCEQRSQLDSCPEATKEPLQEQLARVSTHTQKHTHTYHTHAQEDVNLQTLHNCWQTYKQEY